MVIQNCCCSWVVGSILRIFFSFSSFTNSEIKNSLSLVRVRMVLGLGLGLGLGVRIKVGG